MSHFHTPFYTIIDVFNNKWMNVSPLFPGFQNLLCIFLTVFPLSSPPLQFQIWLFFHLQTRRYSQNKMRHS